MKHLHPDAFAASAEGPMRSVQPAPFEPDSLFGRLHLPSLLVVEQNQETSELLELFLSQAYNLTVVRHHDRVTDLLRAFPYQLVFMGIDEGCEQPAIDALQALRLEDRAGRRTPVVASVCCLDSETERRLFNAGFDGFIKRTFTLRALCDMLNRVLQRENAFA
ncbi:MAG: hypothetical protein R2834_10705 [Rhodothermales bacterium]